MRRTRVWLAVAGLRGSVHRDRSSPPRHVIGGTVRGLVGNAAVPADYARSISWHGYVSKAVVCLDTGEAPIGCQ